MGFTALNSTLIKIFSEAVPNNCHPILSLAKTDQQRLEVKKLSLDDEDDKLHSVEQNKKQRLWRRQAYKLPLTAATSTRNMNELIDYCSHEYYSEASREKRLRLNAIKGTVALFNAVREHQVSINRKNCDSKMSDFQKENILTEITTSDFLDRLSAGISTSKINEKSKNGC